MPMDNADKGLAADRPSPHPSNDGKFWYATDTGELSFSNGVAWLEDLGGGAASSLGSLSDVVLGTEVNGSIFYFNGTDWVPSTGVLLDDANVRLRFPGLGHLDSDNPGSLGLYSGPANGLDLQGGTRIQLFMQPGDGNVEVNADAMDVTALALLNEGTTTAGPIVDVPDTTLIADGTLDLDTTNTLGVNSGAGPVTVTIANPGGNGQRVLIQDVDGSADVNNIILDGDGILINGSPTFTIDVAYGQVDLRYIDGAYYVTPAPTVLLALDDLTDVNAPTPGNFALLYYNGVDWADSVNIQLNDGGNELSAAGQLTLTGNAGAILQAVGGSLDLLGDDFTLTVPPTGDATIGASTIRLNPNVAVEINGELDMLTNTITNVVDPTNPQDAATKAYVDANAGGAAVAAAVSMTGFPSAGTGATQLVPFDVEDYDPDNIFAAGVFTVPETGLYEIAATLSWDIGTFAAGQSTSLVVQINSGAATIESDTQTINASMVTSGQVFSQIVHRLYPLTAGDTVEILSGHNNGGAQSLAGNDGRTTASVRKVA